LLINAAKYANASLIEVSILRLDSNISIQVKDDGNGFDPAVLQQESEKKNGFGLFSVRERLTHIGGTMEIQSIPGKGTQVTLTAPLKSDTQEDEKEPL
jgi:signal transduction histidine kinase